MSRNTEILNQRITEYLTDLYTQNNKIVELESNTTKLKNEIARHKSQLKKHKEDKDTCTQEIEKLKKQLKEAKAK